MKTAGSNNFATSSIHKGLRVEGSAYRVAFKVFPQGFSFKSLAFQSLVIRVWGFEFRVAFIQFFFASISYSSMSYFPEYLLLVSSDPHISSTQLPRVLFTSISDCPEISH